MYVIMEPVTAAPTCIIIRLLHVNEHAADVYSLKSSIISLVSFRLKYGFQQCRGNVEEFAYMHVNAYNIDSSFLRTIRSI